MTLRTVRLCVAVAILAAGVSLVVAVRAQDAPSEGDGPPPVPKGVEVLARGPVHEAFATPTTEPVPTTPVPKKPPKPIQELPPEEKPEGNVTWIGGYYHWDDERKDFLWVSGVWRTPPPGKQWVAGYWREDGEQSVWVPGFWTEAPKQDAPEQELTYLPAPPAPKEANPGQPPSADTFYVPGHYEWINGDYYWRAGFWTKVQPGYVWVPAHYRWSPSGYIYIPGYWDIVVARRGVMYAPVYVDSAVVGTTFVYTPAYAVPETVVVSAMFVRPCCCHYYYGDYYEVRYRDYGYTSCVVYSQSHYDSIVVYETYVHREEPAWINVQIDLFSKRERNPELRPASTSITNANYNTYVANNVTNVTNVTNVNNVNNTNNSTTTNNKTVNNNFLMPAKQLAAAKGVKTVPLDQATRIQARDQAQTVQQVALKRGQEEVAAPAGGLKKPVTKSVPVAKTVPVGPPPKAAIAPSGISAKTPATEKINSANPATGATTPVGIGGIKETPHTGTGAATTSTGTGSAATGTHPSATGTSGTAPVHSGTTGTSSTSATAPAHSGTTGGTAIPSTGATTGTLPAHPGAGSTGATGASPTRSGPGNPGGATGSPGGTPPRAGTSGPTGTGNPIVPTGGRMPAPPPNKPAQPPAKGDKDKDKDKKPGG